jgi:protein involved in sex pheromone biosynthesis
MKKKFIFLMNIITVLMLIGCAPPKEETDNKSKVHTQNDKNGDQNIKLKVGDEEDDVKEKNK